MKSESSTSQLPHLSCRGTFDHTRLQHRHTWPDIHFRMSPLQWSTQGHISLGRHRYRGPVVLGMGICPYRRHPLRHIPPRMDSDSPCHPSHRLDHMFRDMSKQLLYCRGTIQHSPLLYQCMRHSPDWHRYDRPFRRRGQTMHCRSMSLVSSFYLTTGNVQ